MAENKRDLEFDLLRALIIFSALILHYDINVELGVFASPSLLFEKYFFTMGGFFFFTTGYMAQKIYAPRFRSNPLGLSKSLFLKGGGILLMYLAYVYGMHILTAAKLPGSLIAFVYDHRFFTKALFTFSIVIMTLPAFLLAQKIYSGAFWLFLITAAAAIIYYNSGLPVSDTLKKVLFDRELFLYPFIPSFFVLFAGFLISEFVNKYNPGLNVSAGAAILLIAVHVILTMLWEGYADVAFNRNWFTFWEGVTPFLFILIFKKIISVERISKIASSPYVLCIGVYSLHFYFISNLLLGLSSITKKADMPLKIGGFVIILALAYLFTYWRMSADRKVQAI